MKFIKKRKSVLIFSLVLLVFILGLFQNLKTSYGQPQYESSSGDITFNSTFLILENSDESGDRTNVDSINITLPTLTWNVTDITLNFTNIKLGKEVKSIEDQGANIDKKIVWNEKKGYGVQINITEPTTLYGVEIFGAKSINPSFPTSEPVYVQIRGFDDVNFEPNNSIYASVDINMESLGWHQHMFSNSINLSVGYYYLVINGSALTNFDRTIYYWVYNATNSVHQDLWTAKLGVEWEKETQGEPFLYKLIQKVNRSYNPNEINMTVEFDGIDYAVDNGNSHYTGNVTIKNQNFSPENDILNIPIKNNQSIELAVNCSYNLKQRNNLPSIGSALIKENADIIWSVKPNIVRTGDTYSFQFKYPNSWATPSVFYSDVNITSDPNVYIDIAGKTIYVYNDTISPISSWNITSTSPDVNFGATVPTDEYEATQTMRITVTPPSITDNLTFFLVDPYGDKVHSDTSPIGGVLFEYNFSTNPFAGQWNAYILWNNQTDAGLKIIPIQVKAIVASSGGGGGGGSKTVVTGIDPQLIFMVILYVAIASIAGLTSYKMVKRHKRTKAEHREQVFNKYMDLLNLDYIMIIDKKSGLSVYDQILAGKERDSSLISGFLEAIRTFGIDLTGSEEESQTISLQYQNMNVIMNDFKNFRILNVMKESPSQDFLESLRPLSHDIDTFYGKSLKDFDGNVAKFRGVKDLLETHLYTSLIYPLKVIKSKEVKLDSAEKSLMNKAQSMMKKNKTEHFYVSHLMGTSKEFNVKNAEIILKLIEKKVFRPIE